MQDYNNGLEMAMVSEIIAKGVSDSYLDKVIKYVAPLARNPDKGSEFDLKTRHMIESIKDDFELVKTFLSANYDGLVAERDGTLLGLIGYQSHGSGNEIDWHIFRFWVNKGEREQGNCYCMTKEFLKRARKRDVKGIKMSKGKSKQVDNIIKKLLKEQDELGIKVDAQNYWIYLKYNSKID